MVLQKAWQTPKAHEKGFLKRAPVAQGIEQRIPNPCAAGSIPARRTSRLKCLEGSNLSRHFNMDFYAHTVFPEQRLLIHIKAITYKQNAIA